MLVATRRGRTEFFALLRRLPRDLPADEALARHEAARAALGGEAAPGGFTGTHRDAVDPDTRRLRRELAAARRRIAELESSPRWRAGGLLTAPARGLARWRRG